MSHMTIERARVRVYVCVRACLREREGCSDRNVTWMWACLCLE